MEFELVRKLDFKLTYTTPYDYIQPFFETFPWLKTVRQAISDILTFAIGITKLSYDQSENIFYASFLAICELKQCKLTQIQKNIISSQLGEVERILEIKKVIIAAY